MLPMNGQCVAKSLTADLDALQRDLRELHEQARMAAAQKQNQAGTDKGGMVIRGK
jgi:hypothetical protein